MKPQDVTQQIHDAATKVMTDLIASGQITMPIYSWKDAFTQASNLKRSEFRDIFTDPYGKVYDLAYRFDDTIVTVASDELSDGEYQTRYVIYSKYHNKKIWSGVHDNRVEMLALTLLISKLCNWEIYNTYSDDKKMGIAWAITQVLWSIGQSAPWEIWERLHLQLSELAYIARDL